MREKIKIVLVNSIIIFLICFFVLFLIMMYQDYQYYSAYSRKELAEFFSMKKELVWDMQQALSWSTNIMVIVIPILLILEKKDKNIESKNIDKKRNYKNNIKKFLITIGLTSLIIYIYLIFNLKIEF